MVNATEGMGRGGGVLAFLEIVHLVYARSLAAFLRTGVLRKGIEKKTRLKYKVKVTCVCQYF